MTRIFKSVDTLACQGGSVHSPPSIDTSCSRGRKAVQVRGAPLQPLGTDPFCSDVPFTLGCMELLYDTQPRLHAIRFSLAVSSPSTFHSFNLDRHYQMSQAPWTGSPDIASFIPGEDDYGYGSSSPLPGPTLSSGPQAPEQPLFMYNGWSPEDLKLMNNLTPFPNASPRSVNPSQDRYRGDQPSIPGTHTAGLDYRKQAIPTAQVSVEFAKSQHVPDDSRHSFSAEPAGDALDSKVLPPLQTNTQPPGPRRCIRVRIQVFRAQRHGQPRQPLTMKASTSTA